MGNCVSCDRSKLSYSHDYQYRSSQFRELFPNLKVMICSDCNLLQVDHSLLDNAKLTTYYQDSYRKSVGIAITDSRWQQDILNERGRALAACARKHLPEDQVNSIFEVGAGYGVNLLKLKKVYGNAVLQTDEIGKNMIDGEIRQSTIGQGPFDIVLMSHVLEHLIYPKDWINEVQENLRKDGMLIVEVPNEGREYICQASFDLEFHEPHITFFQPKTFKKFFENNFSSSFKVEQISSAGQNISNAMSARASNKPGKFISFCLRQVRRSARLEAIARKSYSNLVYIINRPNIDFSDDSANLNRIFLRAALRKT